MSGGRLRDGKCVRKRKLPKKKKMGEPGRILLRQERKGGIRRVEGGPQKGKGDKYRKLSSAPPKTKLEAPQGENNAGRERTGARYSEKDAGHSPQKKRGKKNACRVQH